MNGLDLDRVIFGLDGLRYLDIEPRPITQQPWSYDLLQPSFEQSKAERRVFPHSP